jgi:cytochrome P450
MTQGASSTSRLAEFEYPSAEVIECPFPFYEALRAESPVHRLPNGDILISRWADIVHVVRHPEIFSSVVGPYNEHVLGGPRVGGDDDGPWQLSFSDDPDHKRNRTLNYFLATAEQLRRFEPRIRAIADGLIDGFLEQGEVEFRSAFAAPLPRRVMMDILGLPPADEARFARWFSGQGPRGARLAAPEDQAKEANNRLELADYMRKLIVERVDQPGTDYLSQLARAQVARDGTLDLPYLVTECVGLFGAAVATTAHFIANALLVLLQYPDELARIRHDQAPLRPLLDEVLRFESPVQWSGRVAAIDTELHGVPIPAGSNIQLMWGSANRDETRFEDADRLWVGRPGLAKYHVGFGYGMHRCLGAPLARQEAEISLQQILARLPNIRLAEGAEITHIQAMNQRAPRTLPIRFDVV